MVAQHAQDIFFSQYVNALVRACIVPHDITKTDGFIDPERMDPLEHGLQRFEIRMDVGDNGDFHGIPALMILNKPAPLVL
jgi:hypothetical protein